MKELTIKLTEGDQTLLNLTLTTEADTTQILDFVHTLSLPRNLLNAGNTGQIKPDLNGVGKKYLPLAEYLVDQSGKVVRLTFIQIEEILRRPLPPTASGEHARSWWANTESHSQGKAWLTAGYKVDFIDVQQGVVEWQKM